MTYVAQFNPQMQPGDTFSVFPPFLCGFPLRCVLFCCTPVVVALSVGASIIVAARSAGTQAVSQVLTFAADALSERLFTSVSLAEGVAGLLSPDGCPLTNSV